MLSIFKYVIALMGASVALSLQASPLKIGAITPMESVLGGEQKVFVTLQAPADFGGTKALLKIDRTELNTVDTENEVQITVTPGEVNIKAGETAQVTLQLNALVSAPSFENGFFKLNVETPETGEMAQAQVALKVPAIYEIGLYANHVWSTPKEAMIRAHKNGVLVRVINFDQTSQHLLHGAGAIPHGTQPMARATPDRHGGVYEFKVAFSQTSSRGLYYCHDHENSTVGHTIIFNAK
jgi:hypothetical protein